MIDILFNVIYLASISAVGAGIYYLWEQHSGSKNHAMVAAAVFALTYVAAVEIIRTGL